MNIQQSQLAPVVPVPITSTCIGLTAGSRGQFNGDEMDTKECSVCRERLRLSCFSKNRTTKDGLQYRCKRCAREYHYANQERILESRREYRIKNHAEVLRKQRARAERGREEKRKYNASPAARASAKKWAIANRHKTRAHSYLHYRVDVAETAPTECQMCGDEKPLHMHHHDYAEPLSVDFLCPRCHGFVHRVLRRIHPLLAALSQ